MIPDYLKYLTYKFLHTCVEVQNSYFSKKYQKEQNKMPVIYYNIV